jgi:hypothetical protein
MPGFFISTPPRSGTHLLVDSIALATKSYTARFTKYDDAFWAHPTIKNRASAVVGIHAHDKYPELLDFAQSNKIITTERHPIGQALSILFMHNRGFIPDWPDSEMFNSDLFKTMTPNSEQFLSYMGSRQFASYREITSDWAKHGNCFSFDKLVLGDDHELNKLSDYVGAKVVLKDIAKSKKKYKDGIVFLGDPHLWKTLVSQEIASKVEKIFPEYNMETYSPTSKDGDWLFKQLLL